MWNAIDFDTKTITIKHTVTRIGKTLHRLDDTKNASSRASFPMSEKIISDLKRWRKWQLGMKVLQSNDYVDEGYVCTKPNGELLSPEYVSKHFKWMLEKHDMPPIRFHDLRHSSASYLKALGFELKDIQVWMRRCENHRHFEVSKSLWFSRL